MLGGRQTPLDAVASTRWRFRPRPGHRSHEAPWHPACKSHTAKRRPAGSLGAW